MGNSDELASIIIAAIESDQIYTDVKWPLQYRKRGNYRRCNRDAYSRYRQRPG